MDRMTTDFVACITEAIGARLEAGDLTMTPNALDVTYSDGRSFVLGKAALERFAQAPAGVQLQAAKLMLENGAELTEKQWEACELLAQAAALLESDQSLKTATTVDSPAPQPATQEPAESQPSTPPLTDGAEMPPSSAPLGQAGASITQPDGSGGMNGTQDGSMLQMPPAEPSPLSQAMAMAPIAPQIPPSQQEEMPSDQAPTYGGFGNIAR